VVVERAKKCLDFTATLYIVHLFICIVHSGMPSNVEWWVLHFTGLVTMAVIGYVAIAPPPPFNARFRPGRAFSVRVSVGASSHPPSAYVRIR
jgi:hypothetical protein